MIGSMIVEFEYDEEDITIRQIEKQALALLEKHLEGAEIINLEASDGNLYEAFGIPEVE